MFSLSLSRKEPSTTPFLPTLLAQQDLFLTSYLRALLEKDFLDIIPKLHPRPCQTQCCLCQTKLSDNSQFYLSCQTDRAKDFGFFCCLVSHLTQCPEIYYENFYTSRPSSLETHAIFHSAQLQFFQGFVFASISPITPGLDSLHTATDSLSGWLLPRSPNYKLCRCSVARNTAQRWKTYHRT